MKERPDVITARSIPKPQEPAASLSNSGGFLPYMQSPNKQNSIGHRIRIALLPHKTRFTDTKIAIQNKKHAVLRSKTPKFLGFFQKSARCF